MSNQSCKLRYTFFSNFPFFKRRRVTSLTQAMGCAPVKPFYHASRTKDGVPAKAYRSIALLRSLARMLARPLFFGKKLIVQVSHPRLLCALLIREHPAVFCHCSHVIVFKI